MPRTLRLALLALLCVGILPAAAGTSASITQTTLKGAPLAKTKAFYRAHYGSAGRLDRLQDGLERLVFPGLEIEVYFRPKQGAGAVGLLTWSPKLRTAEGVGPCSTLASLQKAYGNLLVSIRVAGQSKVVAYRVGKLSFITEGRPRVLVVQLSGKGKGGLDEFAGLNAPECGS